MAIVKYIHYGVEVSVWEDLKGQHSKQCLCYAHCKFFLPGRPNNCPLAQGLYEYDVKNHMVTPVFECPKYEEE